MIDPYATEAETSALIQRDIRSNAQRNLDAMLDDAGAWEQGAEPFKVLYQIAVRMLEQPAQEPVAWRELCRRLYVELFHRDQQMMATRDEDGEPMWQQGVTVRDVLADAKAALDAARPQACEPEKPAQQADSLSPALSDADMDKLATAVNQINAGEKGWHHLMDVALSIAQQPAQQEPVHPETLREIFQKYGTGRLDGFTTAVKEAIALTRPQTREPLTDEQIHDIYDEVARREPYNMAVTRRNIARAIEAAHGIGEKK